jgi:hypothetical protein
MAWPVMMHTVSLSVEYMSCANGTNNDNSSQSQQDTTKYNRSSIIFGPIKLKNAILIRSGKLGNSINAVRQLFLRHTKHLLCTKFI